MTNKLTPIFPIFFVISVFCFSNIVCFVTNGKIWSKIQQKFVGLYTLPQFAQFRNEIFGSRSVLENIDLNGEEIRVAYYEEQNLVSFYDNNTKITGISGEIWTLLSEYLNFTLVPVLFPYRTFGIKLCNGSHSGLLGLLEQNKTEVILRTGLYKFQIGSLDYTMPVWNIRYRLYIRPNYKYDNKWLITLFSPSTAYCIISLFLIVSIVGFILQNTSKTDANSETTHEQYTLFEHIFYTFAMVCSQGYIPSSFYNRHKILSFSKSIFAWLTFLTFSSHLIYRMTNRTNTPPFTDLNSLLNSTKFKILVFRGTMVWESFEKHLQEAAIAANIARLEDRMVVMPTSAKMYHTVCYSKTLYAMFEVDDRYMGVKKSICQLTPTGRSYYDSWVSYGLQKGYRHRKVLNYSLLKFMEVGLIDALRDRYMAIYDDVKVRTDFKTIDLNQVFLLLLILCIGILLSAIVFVIEQCFFIYTNKQN